MNYSDNITKEIEDLESLKKLVTTLPLTDEQKRLMAKIIEEALFRRDYQLKQTEINVESLHKGK